MPYKDLVGRLYRAQAALKVVRKSTERLNKGRYKRRLFSTLAPLSEDLYGKAWRLMPTRIIEDAFMENKPLYGEKDIIAFAGGASAVLMDVDSARKRVAALSSALESERSMIRFRSLERIGKRHGRARWLFRYPLALTAALAIPALVVAAHLTNWGSSEGSVTVHAGAAGLGAVAVHTAVRALGNHLYDIDAAAIRKSMDEMGHGITELDAALRDIVENSNMSHFSKKA